MFNKNNSPVVAAIKIDGLGNYNGIEIETNLIKSAYGKDNFNNYIDNAVNDNRILFFDKKRSQELLKTPGVYFPNNLQSLDFNNNISHYREIVNNLQTYKMKYKMHTIIIHDLYFPVECMMPKNTVEEYDISVKRHAYNVEK